MNWLEQIKCIQQRLPELERQLLKYGDFFPVKLLPKGLFKEVKSSQDCLADISRDLELMGPQNSQAMAIYLSERISKKIHVLVHICRSQQPRSRDSAELVVDKMSTRMQWLAQIELKRKQVSAQRAAIVATMHTKQSTADLPIIHALQQELHAIDVQLLELS